MKTVDTNIIGKSFSKNDVDNQELIKINKKLEIIQ